MLTARGLTTYACRRVSPSRRLSTAQLVGPWSARVFSRLLCGFFGKDIRFDAIPVRGGGYRVTISSPLAPKAPFVAIELRPQRRGGVSFQLESCVRLSK
jgi:hypothetical protein